MSLVTSIDLDRCGNFIDKVREERYNRVKARQVRKCQILFSKSKQNKDRYKNKNQNRSGQSVNATRQGHMNNRLDYGSQLEGGKYNNKWVINLSKTSLTEAQKAVLAKGPNYAIMPSHISNVDYITAIECMCPKLREDDVMELRSDINSLLRKAKVPKANLTKQEKIGLSKLKMDKDRAILAADKGVAIVIMDKVEYNKKHRSY